MCAEFLYDLERLEQDMRDIYVCNHEIADEIRMAWQGWDATEYLDRFLAVNASIAETADQLRAVSQFMA